MYGWALGTYSVDVVGEFCELVLVDCMADVHIGSVDCELAGFGRKVRGRAWRL